MTPMLGIMASAASGNLWKPSADFDSIATITPYTTTTTVVFNSIPSTYRHLQLRASAAGSAAANMTIRFNGDTAANYSWHYMSANGSTIVTGGGANGTYILGPVVTNTASSYTGIIIDILDYKNTNKDKTMRTLSGQDLNGSSNWLEFDSGIWYNNTSSAINSITINLSGATFAANSHWALYGIK
jgi:hypothetical protein